MTTPAERTRAVLFAKSFLEDLLDSKKTPRIPKLIRERAYNILRHYPNSFDMEMAAGNEFNYKAFGKSTDPY